MQNENIKLELMDEKDLELVLAWRSNELIYRHFKEQSEPLEWQSHHKWFLSRKNRQDWIIYFFEENRWRRVGSINISKLDSAVPEIGLFVGEITLMGKGVGSKSLRLILNWLKEQSYTKTRAIIHKNNVASQKLFSKFGFVLEENQEEKIFQSYSFTLKKAERSAL